MVFPKCRVYACGINQLFFVSVFKWQFSRKFGWFKTMTGISCSYCKTRRFWCLSRSRCSIIGFMQMQFLSHTTCSKWEGSIACYMTIGFELALKTNTDGTKHWIQSTYVQEQALQMPASFPLWPPCCFAFNAIIQTTPFKQWWWQREAAAAVLPSLSNLNSRKTKCKWTI